MTARSGDWLKNNFAERDPYDYNVDLVDSMGLWTDTLTVGEDGDGDDVIFYGDTAGSQLHWDADTDTLELDGTTPRFRIGDFTGGASGTGSVVSASATAPLKVYADDGGAAIGSGSLVRAGWFRNLQTYTGGNREQEAAGVQGSIVSVAGTNRHNMCGVLGSYEARTSLTVDGQAATTDTWCQAGVIGRVGAANNILTIASNGVLAGVAAMSNVTTALASNAGVYAGLYIGKWGGASGTDSWGHGIYIQALAVDKAIQVGELSSTVSGSGVAMTDDVTRVMEVHADDANAARTAGIQGRAIFGRTMIYANTTQENWGVDGLVKWSTVAHTGNVNAGMVGRFEAIGTNSTATGIGNTFCAGVMGRVGIASNAFTIGTGTWVAGVLAFYNTSTTNNPATGYTSAFMATASDIAGTGDWDYGLYIEDTTTGIYIDPASTNGIHIGVAATADGSGLTTAATAPVGFYFDDGGTGVAAYRECFNVGLVLPTASTGAAQTGFPSACHVYIDQRANITAPAASNRNMTALWAGYLVRNSSTLDGFDDGGVSALQVSLDVATGCTLASGATMAGISFGGNWSLGTVSGDIFPLHFPPVNANWTGFFKITGGQDEGLVQDAAAGSGTPKYLKCYLGSTLYTIVMTPA